MTIKSLNKLLAITLLILLLIGDIQCKIKTQTVYIPQPYKSYKLCVKSKCEKLFCPISDRNCQREATKSERCFFDWEMEANQDDMTILPHSLRLCMQECPADKFESEEFHEIEECNFNCAYQYYQVDL